MSNLCRQRGSVIIVTLWTITLMTLLVAVLAAENRLSAQVAYRQQQELLSWSALAAAVNQAQMELMLEQMPLPVESEDFASFEESMDAIGRNRANRFNGQPLTLYYPQDPAIDVRIIDHAGKINLQNLSRPRLRSLIEKKLGGPQRADQRQIDDMMEAWNDWIDLNDGASAAGAESEYYEALDVPFTPRNGALETVEELLQIRGFAEVFGDVNLDAAFTLYGEDDLINLNVATIDAMRLLPGLTDELIAEILAYRQEKEFQGNGDVAQVVPAENMAELRPWLNSRKNSLFYTILAHVKPGASIAGQSASSDEQQESSEDRDDEQPAASSDAEQQYLTAYAETVQLLTPNDRPRVLKVQPYQKLPLSALPVTDPEGALR